jgi:formiminotetrahydrofolate cyclodeaminase
MSKHIESKKQAARRAFLKKAGTAAATVPAAAVLLSVAEKSALAQSQSGSTLPT